MPTPRLAATPTPVPAIAASPALPSAVAPVTPATPAPTGPSAPTIATVDRLTAWLRDHPDDPAAYRDLGLSLLQRARETADAAFYDRAEAALTTALALAPGDDFATVGIGSLQLARHRFADALATGRTLVARSPDLAAAHGIVVDALVELGRYDEAIGALQAMVDLREDLASLARVSYLRELHGDLRGALEAMERAAAAGALAPEGDAYVTTLAGDLHVLLGERELAAVAYDRALEEVPGYAPARAAQGRLAITAGDLPGAIEAFRDASTTLPLPEYVIALGEALEASGDTARAEDAYGLVRVETQLLQASGVVVDLELALFEADHGDPATAVELAEAAYAERQTVHTADALAWALHRAGRTAEARRHLDEALRLGTLRPSFRYHAGVIAAATGDVTTARRELRLALALDPGFSATGAAAARAALDELAG